MSQVGGHQCPIRRRHWRFGARSTIIHLAQANDGEIPKPSLSGDPLGKLADPVGMPGVACGLVDQSEDHPTKVCCVTPSA